MTTGQQVPDDIETADAEALVGDLLATHLASGRMPQVSMLGRNVA
jgi:flagellar biosynthesis GTPase FlhF